MAEAEDALENALASLRCECCGMEEECTAGYAGLVRSRHCGRWVCGLCAEAILVEQLRLPSGSCHSCPPLEEALQAHFQHHRCRPTFTVGSADSSPAAEASPVALIAAAMTRTLRRTFSNSHPSAPCTHLPPRSSSCISTLPRHDCNAALQADSKPVCNG